MNVYDKSHKKFHKSTLCITHKNMPRVHYIHYRHFLFSSHAYRIDRRDLLVPEDFPLWPLKSRTHDFMTCTYCTLL